MERRVPIFRITAKKRFQLNGANPHTITFGTEADISNLYQYGWYKWVYFRDVKKSFPYQKEYFGRCLRPAKNEGNAMAQWILKGNRRVVPRHTLRRLLPAELAPSNEVEADKWASFTTSIREVLGDSVKIPKEVPLDNNDTEAFDAIWDLEPHEDDYEYKLFIPDADLKDAAGKPFVHQLLADALINAKVLLPHEDSQTIAQVVEQAVNDEGRMIGTFNKNPLLNTLLYDCEFNEGLRKNMLQTRQHRIFLWSRTRMN
jgi:hypothetical protein